MIELKITGNEEKECFCQLEGNALDLAAEASVAISKILEPLPSSLQCSVLLIATIEAKNRMKD